MEGWIKLHRKLTEWEWYTDINTKCLFIHFILKANHKAAKWKGIDIPEGSLITSIDNLSKETGLSVQQIRTSINKLKSTNEVTSKATNKFTLITICKYVNYQLLDRVEQQAEQQTNNKQVTTNKKVNKEKNIHGESCDSPTDITEEEFAKVWEWYEKKGNRKTSLAKWAKLSKKDKEAIRLHIPKYVASTPKQQYRKNFETYLNQRAWEDEILNTNLKNNEPEQKQYRKLQFTT